MLSSIFVFELVLRPRIRAFFISTQLFPERLSEKFKVHATIPRGVVGGFEFIFLQRNLQQCHEGP